MPVVIEDRTEARARTRTRTTAGLFAWLHIASGQQYDNHHFVLFQTVFEYWNKVGSKQGVDQEIRKATKRRNLWPEVMKSNMKPETEIQILRPGPATEHRRLQLEDFRNGASTQKHVRDSLSVIWFEKNFVFYLSSWRKPRIAARHFSPSRGDVRGCRRGGGAGGGVCILSLRPRVPRGPIHYAKQIKSLFRELWSLFADRARVRRQVFTERPQQRATGNYATAFGSPYANASVTTERVILLGHNTFTEHSVKEPVRPGSLPLLWS
ncbi:hypothetical protein J6590_001574 [Homalodisca vitripennis]|nr:hypothetical protein J6590_001574 [Homalodisca vitripennis]